MKEMIFDTNIIFSCLLNSQGIIGGLIYNSETGLSFIAICICVLKFLSIGKNF